MFGKPLIYVAVAALLIAGAIGALIVRNGHGDMPPTSKRLNPEFPELSSILNKTGNYSLTYINAQGRRLAAVDNSGAKYFYLYDAKGGPLAIMNGTSSIIWKAASYP